MTVSTEVTPDCSDHGQSKGTMVALWTITTVGGCLVVARTAVSLYSLHKIAIADILAAASSVRPIGTLKDVEEH